MSTDTLHWRQNRLLMSLLLGESVSLGEAGRLLDDRSKRAPLKGGAARDALVARGLLRAVAVAGSRTRTLEPTDAAWVWISEHLDAACCGSQVTQADRLFQRLRSVLKSFLDARNLAFVDLMVPAGAAFVAEADEAGADHRPEPGAAPAHVDTEERILSEARRLCGGDPGRRVRLADLRAALPDVPRSEQDHALCTLYAQRQIALFRLDDPFETFPADRAAVLRIDDFPFHLLYLKA